MTFDGRMARVTRLAALLFTPPLLAFAYIHYCKQTPYGIALAYVPVLFGGIGLVARSAIDAAAGRRNPRYEFSGKGAGIGAAASFFLLLAFAPPGADRTALVALFFASSTFYYAVGKVGCLFLGCCRAALPGRLPLPAIEAIGSLALSSAALATLYATAPARLALLAAIVAGTLALRLFSRCARGSRLRGALGELDSIALGALACCTAAIAAFR